MARSAGKGPEISTPQGSGEPRGGFKNVPGLRNPGSVAVKSPAPAQGFKRSTSPGNTASKAKIKGPVS